MAKIYFERIKAGIMTIDDVPSRWRNAVQKLIESDGDITDSDALDIILGKED